MTRHPAINVIIWWEKRRPLFNLAVLGAGVVAGLSIFMFGSLVGPPGEADFEPFLQMILVILYGIAANVCYTLGWVTEILWSGGDLASTEKLRPKIFRLGLIFSVVLTLLPAVAVPLLWLVFG